MEYIFFGKKRYEKENKTNLNLSISSWSLLMQNLMKTWHCSKDKCLNTYTLVVTSLVTSRSWPWTTSLAPFIFFIIKGDTSFRLCSQRWCPLEDTYTHSSFCWWWSQGNKDTSVKFTTQLQDGSCTPSDQSKTR